MGEYVCSICGFANDPNYYAMTKYGIRWFHNLCIEKVTLYVLRNYDVAVDALDGFRVVRFEEKAVRKCKRCGAVSEQYFSESKIQSDMGEIYCQECWNAMCKRGDVE